MSLKVGKKIRSGIRILLIPIVLLLSWNAAANWHYHILDDGTIIQHSHPFSSSSSTDRSPSEGHHHSNCEYCQVFNLSSSYIHVDSFSAPLIAFSIYDFDYSDYVSYSYYEDHYYTYSGLSPPLI
ncbi:MAG: hypothetical protein ACEPOV_00305 [Hyphomicrobiales bacterium]